MNGTPDLERLLTDWMTSAAPSHAPRQTVDDVISTTSTHRPRPTMLALMRTPPMTTPPSALVGSVPVRTAYLLAIVLAAGTLAVATVATGTRFLTRAAEPAAFMDGLIAVDVEGDIAVAEPDGSSLRRLTEGPDNEVSPSFSPNGELLAFWSTPDGANAARLVVMRPDGQERREFEAGPGWLFKTFVIGSPNISWSPDGARIAAVVSGATGTTIGLVDLATGTFTPLDVGAFDVTFVTWSPDGESLAYIGSTMGREVFVIRPDGTGETSVSPVATDAPSYLSVDWSPDSQRVTYSRSDGDGSFAVYSADVASGTETPIASGADAGANYWWPTFSPDGSRLASGGDQDGAAAVFIGLADGSEWDHLAIPRPVTTEDVTWSPDGRSLLVYASDLQSLLVVPIDDPDALVAIPTPGSLGSPSWQRLAR
jgi:WD40 repeat protein